MNDYAATVETVLNQLERITVSGYQNITLLGSSMRALAALAERVEKNDTVSSEPADPDSAV